MPPFSLVTLADTLSRLCCCSISVGDNVMVKAGSPDEPSYVGLVVDHRKDKLGNKQLKLQWYYRPEDSRAGRQVRECEVQLCSEPFLSWLSIPDHTNCALVVCVPCCSSRLGTARKSSLYRTCVTGITRPA